jgi:hypothetical protein
MPALTIRSGPRRDTNLSTGNKRYPPKAIVGLACRYFLGRILLPEEFSGGEAPGQANFVLRKLGFTVVKKGAAETEDQTARRDWSEGEVRLIVADYFAMLEKELLGKPYSKTDHRLALGQLLGGRSEGAIEFKHANISAVLAGQGLPYLEGYKPRGNYQSLLVQEVEAFLDRSPAFLEQLAAAPSLNPVVLPTTDRLDLESIVEDPPEEIIAPGGPEKPWLSRKGRRIDFAERDAANRLLGRLGEQFVVMLEQQWLHLVGRDDLAQRVEWVAQTKGEGLGFDVLSFNDSDDSEKLIEVKTTSLGKFFPFYVTANEVRCSEDVPERFHLFRVFDFARMPRVYVLPGSLRLRCRLEPTLFRATLDRTQGLT